MEIYFGRLNSSEFATALVGNGSLVIDQQYKNEREVAADFPPASGPYLVKAIPRTFSVGKQTLRPLNREEERGLVSHLKTQGTTLVIERD